MPFQTINNVNYHYKIWGRGEPILLLHGFTGCWENWEPTALPLATDYQVIAIDLLGHGRTTAPDNPERYQMGPATADLARFFEQLNLETVSLLGYSMGGRLALTFALEYPHKIKRLILESASPGLRSPKERSERIKRDSALADRIEQKGMPAFVDFWEAVSLWESQLQVEPERRRKLRQLRLKNRPQGLANSLRGMGTGRQPSNWERLSHLLPKTHLLTGELDQKFCNIAVEMLQQMSNTSHIIVPNVGHTVHFEAPEKYLSILKALQMEQ